MTIADYTDRTVDIFSFSGEVIGRETLLQQALAQVGQPGTVCTGIQKLAQRWLIEFLTEAGTLLYLPTRGCDFITQVRMGVLQTTLDAQQAFLLSALTVQSNLTAEEDAATPLDEAFASVDLIAISVIGDTISLRVQINSQAGTSVKIILPIATAPQIAT